MPADEEVKSRPAAEDSENGAEGDAASDSQLSEAEAPAEPEAPDAAELQVQLGAAQKERDELRDRLLRSQAEFENIRKSLQREKEDVVRFAASGTIEALLPVADDFERAINAEGVAPEIREGLELIHRRMFDVFRRAGLEEVEQHETFDPNLHFAVDRAPATDGQERDQILEVYQKGYRFKGRLLRASMVKVAV